ncbi:MAG: nucleotidyltransferase domain-containing protein [Methylocystis silviterrae]
MRLGLQRRRILEDQTSNCYIQGMRRKDALDRLLDRQADLQKLGVKSLYMFGSTAQDRAGESSDVDLFFDYEKGRFGLFELMDVKEFAARILGGRVDIMTRDSVHKRLRPQIEATALRVF